MGKMSAEQKLIEEISGRKYEVEGPYGHETITPNDFILSIREVAGFYVFDFAFYYELFRLRDNERVPVLSDFHKRKWWPILESVNPAEVKRRYKKKARFFLKQAVRKEKMKSYLPDALMDDIVELFFIKGNIKRYGSA